MKRYLQIWLAQIRYSVVRELMFKANFLLWVFVEICWLCLQLTFVQVLYFHVDEIAGWSKWQMVLLFGTNQLVQMVYYSFFIINQINISELVRTGNLDYFLAQPASPQFLISTRKFDPESFVNIFIAIGVIFYASFKLAISWSIGSLFLYFLLICTGVLVHYSLVLALMTPIFWMKRGQGLMSTYHQTFSITRTPRRAFHGFFKFFFSWIFPFLLIANVPARTLLDGIHWRETLFFLGITAVIFWGSSRFFHYGLKRYGSASS